MLSKAGDLKPLKAIFTAFQRGMRGINFTDCFSNKKIIQASRLLKEKHKKSSFVL